MDFARGIATLRSRGKWAIVLCWFFIATCLLSGLGQLLEGYGLVDLDYGEDGLTLLIALDYLAYALCFFVSYIAVGMWIYRAHANLTDAGFTGLEFSPGWSVGWFFIPFANLVKPFQAMRELWNASHGEEGGYSAPASRELVLWWSCWISGSILDGVSSQLTRYGTEPSSALGGILGALAAIALAAAAFFLIPIIKQVTEAQRSGLTAANVFA